LFAEKQAALAQEAAHLQRMKEMLEEEKSQAMEVIERAGRMAAGAESRLWEDEHVNRGTADAGSMNAMVEDASFDSVSKKRERADTDLLQLEETQRKKLNSEDSTQLRECSSSSKLQISAESSQAAVYLNNLSHDKLRAISSRDCKPYDAGGWPSGSVITPNNDASYDAADSDRHTNHMEDHFPDVCSNISYLEYEAACLPSSFSHHHEGHEKLTRMPEQMELEMMMRNLLQSRQFCMSQLKEMEERVLSFPPSIGFTLPVQQGLSALSARLSLMEQIEDGLQHQLWTAFEDPNRPGAFVDKVQLLARMQEQQSLRAEWEDDLQRQLQTIDMLQAPTFQSASNLRSPYSHQLLPGPPSSSSPSLTNWQPYVSNSSTLSYSMPWQAG
jgi:hypothetical protein